MVDRRLSSLARPIIVAVVFLLLGNTSLAIDLRPETIEAFNKFVASVEMRLDSRFIGQTFLWSDEFPGVRQQLLKGIVVVQPLQGNGIVSLKGGLVQDWRGAVFIPYVSLREVLSIVQDYDHHRDFYKPEIADAKIESHQGDEFVVYMRIVKAKFMLSDVLNTEHAIQFVHVDQKRVYSRSYSKRINEVAAPGQTGEHELPSGHDRGLLWRMNGYWFFEERDDGVYITCESITLTRDIPFGMATLIGPVIHDLPGEALRKSLEQTRRAIAPRTTKLYDRRQDEISRDEVERVLGLTWPARIRFSFLVPIDRTVSAPHTPPKSITPDRLLLKCAPSASSLTNFPPSRSGKFAVF